MIPNFSGARAIGEWTVSAKRWKNADCTTPSRKQVTKGQALGSLPTASKSGFSLVGWFTEQFGGEANLVEDGGTAFFEGFQNFWTSKYKQVGRALFYTSSKKPYKTFTQSWDIGGQTCPLTLKITSMGAVTATLTYDTGKKSKGKVVYYKPTCTTVVKPMSDADPNTFTGQIQLYFAPSAGNNFPGWTEVITVSP